MDTKESNLIYWEHLISSRNLLLNNRMNDDVKGSLNFLLKNTDCIFNIKIRNIFEKCIPKVLDDISNSENLQAAFLLNLIHNLPLADENGRWDVCYFLSFELPQFLERLDADCERAKIVLYICGQLADYIQN